MSNCQVPMPTYERPEPVGELVDSLKRENDALKERVRELEDERRIWLDGWAVNRITELEALVRDMHGVMWACRERDCEHREKGCWRVYGEGDGDCWLEKRMSALGIEVDA